MVYKIILVNFKNLNNMTSFELKTFYDITYEEDRVELAEAIRKGIRLETTILAPEDLSEVISSIKDLINKCNGDLINIDTSRWPNRLIIVFKIEGNEKKLVLNKVEEGAYKPTIE